METCWYDTISLVDLHGSESHKEGFVRMREVNMNLKRRDGLRGCYVLELMVPFVRTKLCTTLYI